MLPRYDRMKWKPKFLTLLLLIFLCVHQTSPHVPDVDESKVESWVVERRSDMSDLFTVSMKSGSRCYHEWSGKFSANYLSLVGNYESCTYYCDPKFPTFLPSLQTCINATLAASIGGCDAGYFDDQKLLDVPVKLAAKGKKDFSIETDDTCTLSRSYYVHDYSCFWSRWRNVSDGFFNIDVKKHHFEIEWNTGDKGKLAGRIIRLVVTCTSYTRCVLLKAVGTVTLTLNTGTPALPRPTSSFILLTRSQTTRISAFTTGQILLASRAGLQSLLPVTSDDTTNKKVSTGIPLHSTSVVVFPTEPLKTTSSMIVPASSAGGGGNSGDRGTQTGENENGVVIGAAVGGALVLGIFVIIIIVFWKRRKAGKTMEKQSKQVKNLVYGTSKNDIQLESPNNSESQTMLSRAQDNQPTYQGLLTVANGHSNGKAVYSNPEDEYDNCTVYQSLEKPRPGTPVYQSLKAGQVEPVHTTGPPNLKPKPRYTTLPNATGTPIAKGKTATGVPKPNPGAKGQPSQRSSLTPEPVYNVLDGPGSEQGTTPEPLYNVLEGPDRGQDYEATNVDPPYNVLEGPNTTYDSAEIVLESNGAQNGPISGQSPDNDPLYNVLEGPESDQKSLEHGPSTGQEPLYNVLEGPGAKKIPLVEQGAPINEPLYNVLEGPDSGGSNQHAPNKPRPLSGHDNLAYEQTLEMDVPNAAVQRPGTQRESVYEALREPTEDLYEALGESGDPHSTC